VQDHLRRYAVLSIAAALVTMAIKLTAWLLTDSVGLLSDALESSVNLAAALFLAAALHVAARPADESHLYGHDKAEYFSAGAEGFMIVVAAGLIVWQAVERLLHPRELEQVGWGLAISLTAAGVNLAVALVLLRAGRDHGSLALVADGKHLLTDVWTSMGVVVGVGLVVVTGWGALDPLVAIAVGMNILVTGGRLVWRSGSSLLDAAVPDAERAALQGVLDTYEPAGVRFHALRSRVAGRRRFVTVHLLVPGSWTVQQGHDLAERVERDLRAAVPHLTVHTHLEPLDDPASYRDDELG
jgi:cation diffusion facilitator family transporter